MRKSPEVTCLGKWCAPVFGDWHLAHFPRFIAREPRSPQGPWGIFLALLVWNYFALPVPDVGRWWPWEPGHPPWGWRGWIGMGLALCLEVCCLKVAFCGGGIQTAQIHGLVPGLRRKARGCVVVSTTRGRRLCNLSVAANRNPAKARRNAAEGIFVQAYG